MILDVQIHRDVHMQSHNLPLVLRHDIPEAHEILGFSRSQLYKHIAAGKIRVQKDGKRTFITTAELQRYVADLSAAEKQAA